MIIHSPIISGSLTFANGSTLTLPPGSVYSGSFSGSYQGDTFSGGVFTGDGSGLTFGGTGIISSSAQLSADFLDTLGDGVVSGSSQIVLQDADKTGFTGASSITTLGTITTGSWQGSIIASQYLDADPLPAGTISGSAQVVLQSADKTGFTGASSITTLGTVTSGNVTSILPSGTVSGSSQVTFNDISSNPFQNGSGLVNTTGHLLPATNEIYDLGSSSKRWRDLYLSGSTIDLGGTLISRDSSTGNLGFFDGGTGNPVSADVSFDTILNKPTLVSGSSQIDLGSASGNVALGTQTTGNYVATLGTGTGVTIGSNTGEGSTPTIAVDYGSTANTAVQGNTSITFAGTSNEITIDGGSSITLGSGGTVTIGLADSITGNRTFSNDVTITGNLTVNGTTTTVNSNTVNIGDNILILNSDEAGTPSQNGGLEIERGTSTNASLIWDESSDSWKAGLAAAEVELVTISGTQTLTNKTINGSQLVNGSVANGKLENSTISGISLGSNLNTLTIGTGLSGTSYNGSSAVTIANTGVLSITSNTGLSSNVSATGNVTITNTGVTSITGTANQVIASASTGGVTLSLPQSIATNSTVQFGKVGVGGASDATYELKVTGDIGATGDIVAYVSSDERLKKNIELISNPIQKVQALKGVTWVWKDEASDAAKQSPNVGVIAQDVEKVLPQLVHDRENGYKGVDYAKMVGLLIEAIKDQQKQIDELKSRLG